MASKKSGGLETSPPAFSKRVSQTPNISQVLSARGVRTHNLKNIDIDIPLGSLCLITGPSGSGKSSLAYDTIFAESQRRFAENLSSRAKQYFSQLPQADFDLLEGLSPAIALRQGLEFANKRSTVGTITEVYEYLRVLYAKLGVPNCHSCDRIVRSLTPSQMCDLLMEYEDSTRIELLADRGIIDPDSFDERIDLLRKEGVIRIRIDDEEFRIDEELEYRPKSQAHLYIVFDRMKLKDGIRSRLADSIESCLALSGGVLNAVVTPSREEAKTLTFFQQFSCQQCGVELPILTPQYFSFNNPEGACSACDGLGFVAPPDAENSIREFLRYKCESCKGSRLSLGAKMVEVGGMSLAELSEMPLGDLKNFLSGLSFSDEQAKIAKPLVEHSLTRIVSLIDSGLSYLSIGRSSLTLSRGELQRVRISAQLTCGLNGILYVLDEPSLGLHPEDCRRLLAQLKLLRDQNNSVLAVEHQPDMCEAADYLVEIGPGAGEAGGRIIYAGDPKTRNLQKKIELERGRSKPTSWIRLDGVSVNNLRGLSVELPLGLITTIAGVSGSGKTSLLMQALSPALKWELQDARKQSDRDENWGVLSVEDKTISQVVSVNQSAISNSPRSNPATYLGIFTPIRDLMAMVADSKVRGFSSTRFSFNVKGGRCEACRGAGVERVQMELLSDVFVTCKECSGKRYNAETLSVRYKGLSIAQILDLTAVEGATFFNSVPKVSKKLRALVDVGLGYLRLGQPAPSLSGGEAQRLKLANALGTKGVGKKTIFLFDEPTSGLHRDDITLLLAALRRLADEGHGVLSVSHNMQFIAGSAWVLELGPGAGEAGGGLVFAGTAEQLAKGDTITARHLKNAVCEN